MKKLLAIFLVTIMSLMLASCSSNTPDVPDEPPVLLGNWEQINSKSSESYHIAVVTDTEIEIYWYNETDDTKALYWSGSFKSPTSADEPYSWDSKNNKQKTDNALLASSDPTKTFTYENGQIKYEASAMGATQTIKLEMK